jgi:hypothetical protein
VKRITLSLGIIALMVLGVQMSFNTTSFPGFHSGAQCGICHNEPAVAWNESYASEAITLDGDMTEPFWAEADDNNMYVPLGQAFGFEGNFVDDNGTDHEVPLFVSMRFAQNSSHLFIRARIQDNTQTGSTTYNAAGTDGFAILWNINQAEFKLPDATPNFGPGNDWDNWMSMDGDNLDGGKQDLVYFSPSLSGESDASYNVTSGGYDNNTQLTTSVWDKNYGGTASESEDWSAGAFHGKENTRSDNGYYSIELTRPLVTDDENDVQFTYDGYYEFAVAAWNDTKGAAHSASFEHTIWVHGDLGAMPLDTITVTAPGTTVTAPGTTDTTTSVSTESPWNSLLSIFGLITMSLAVMVYRKRK